ncbi:MAG: glycosyltransferase family 4 protein [Cyanobacteria bacterium P01_C01_bin.38]
MRLTLVVPSLQSGGAERASVLLAEGLLQKGHEVSIVTLYAEEADFYELPTRVKRLALNIASDSPTLFHGVWNNFNRISVLRKEIRLLQPDIVISFLKETNILTLLALINTNIPVIISEQNNPVLDASGGLWDKLRIFIYPTASKVVSCSKGVNDCFDWLSEDKRAIIYNPLTPIASDQKFTNISKSVTVDSDQKLLVAMGRLTHQKGFDILLSAFHKISDKYQQWQLVILGEGELRSALEKQIEELGLTNRVMLPGVIKNPFPLLKQSEIFVLSSRYEGFGNVIIEAMACGLPVISTDCPSGPREIINHQVDGILVPTEDVWALASSIERLILDPQEAAKLAETARKTVERFKLQKIVENWEDLIAEVSNQKIELAF